LGREMLGDVVSYLLPNTRVTVDWYEGQPIGVTPPKTVDLRVTDTAPGLKTATVTNVLKPATTETGLIVPVPNFVETGDPTRVDTDGGTYMSRVKIHGAGHQSGVIHTCHLRNAVADDMTKSE